MGMDKRNVMWKRKARPEPSTGSRTQGHSRPEYIAHVRGCITCRAFAECNAAFALRTGWVS